MASILQTLHSCLFGTSSTSLEPTSASSSSETIKASEIIRTLFSADKGGKDLEKTVTEIVGAQGWTESLAKAILGGIENGLKEGVPMGNAMKEASEKAISSATEFAHDHPFFCALIAVGILAILMPWALEALGFAELGPVEGSFAAWWQSMYGGYVPRKSLFAFLQRVGMVWRRSVVMASM